jgi:hypothetical protein
MEIPNPNTDIKVSSCLPLSRQRVFIQWEKKKKKKKKRHLITGMLIAVNHQTNKPTLSARHRRKATPQTMTNQPTASTHPRNYHNPASRNARFYLYQPLNASTGPLSLEVTYRLHVAIREQHGANYASIYSTKCCKIY